MRSNQSRSRYVPGANASINAPVAMVRARLLARKAESAVNATATARESPEGAWTLSASSARAASACSAMKSAATTFIACSLGPFIHHALGLADRAFDAAGRD